MDEFLQIIKNITYYLLLVGFVLTFLGESVYKKYVRFFMGIILILIIFSPLMDMFSLDTVFQSKLQIGGMQLEYSEAEALKDANMALEEAGKAQENGMAEKYQEMIKEHLNQSLKEYPINIQKVEIELGEEIGTLKSMKIIYKETSGEEKETDGEEAVDRIKIDKIEIEKNMEQMEKEKNVTLPILEEKVTSKIEEIYQLPRASIVLEKIVSKTTAD